MRSQSLFLAALCTLLADVSHAAVLEWYGKTLEGAACSGNPQGFGPYDFFDVDEQSDPMYQEARWWEVRVIHAEAGLAAMREEPFDQVAYNRAAAEFDYTLRAFPNNPAILQAMILLEMKRRATRGVERWQTPPECYLERALAFRPEQPHVYQLYAMYLHRLGNVDAALEYYERALTLDSMSAELHYNIGLAYVEKEDYENASQHARRAYALGFPLPGLRNKLRAAGVRLESPAE